MAMAGPVMTGRQEWFCGGCSVRGQNDGQPPDGWLRISARDEGSGGPPWRTVGLYCSLWCLAKEVSGWHETLVETFDLGQGG